MKLIKAIWFHITACVTLLLALTVGAALVTGMVQLMTLVPKLF